MAHLYAMKYILNFILLTAIFKSTIGAVPGFAPEIQIFPFPEKQTLHIENYEFDIHSVRSNLTHFSEYVTLDLNVHLTYIDRPGYMSKMHYVINAQIIHQKQQCGNFEVFITDQEYTSSDDCNLHLTNSTLHYIIEKLYDDLNGKSHPGINFNSWIGHLANLNWSALTPSILEKNNFKTNASSALFDALLEVMINNLKSSSNGILTLPRIDQKSDPKHYLALWDGTFRNASTLKRDHDYELIKNNRYYTLYTEFKIPESHIEYKYEVKHGILWAAGKLFVTVGNLRLRFRLRLDHTVTPCSLSLDFAQVQMGNIYVEMSGLGIFNKLAAWHVKEYLDNNREMIAGYVDSEIKKQFQTIIDNILDCQDVKEIFEFVEVEFQDSETESISINI